MKRSTPSLCLLMFSGIASAAPLPQAEVVIHTPVDNAFSDDKLLLNKIPQLPSASKPMLPSLVGQPAEGEDKELFLSRAIQEAMLSAQWDEVERLLGEYAKLPNFDAVQYVYVWGMVYKQKNQFTKAISLFKQLLEKRPHLVYVRLNYAMLLFDNKQYKEAAEQFKLVSKDSSVTPDVQQLIQSYQTAMDEAQSWKYDFGGNYTQTNNVNNAPESLESTSSIFLPGGRQVVVRNEQPKSAHGIRYYVSANKGINLMGNHYLVLGAGYSGTTYWDAHEYDFKQADATLGYEYRTARYTVGVTGLGLQNWLGKSRYSHLWGVGTSFTYNISPVQQLSVNYNYLKRRYHDDEDKGYNGQINQFGFTYIYALPPSWQFFVGSDVARESTQTRYYSSRRVGGRAGFIFNKEDSFGLRVDARYAIRKFDGKPWFIATDVANRRDHETSIDFSFWHNKIQWKGFVPKVNISWSRTRSNIPEWYNRRNTEVFLTVEKSF